MELPGLTKWRNAVYQQACWQRAVTCMPEQRVLRTFAWRAWVHLQLSRALPAAAQDLHACAAHVANPCVG
jgi:hypothetical protein